ncbi:MAG: trypsin-like peptidase domain-containing protein, partial [Chloroflexi bacterium]|nr:trypsin-like peptidase domain-containing protein [Chloroflexota bacterium]
MTAVNKLQKFFIGGLAALVLTTAIACSGGTDAVDPTVSTVPTTEQVSNAGDDSSALLAGTVTPAKAGSGDTVSHLPGDSDGAGGSIQTAFAEDDSERPTGDALPEIVVEESPELAPGVPPEVWINVLTPAEIVAAQGEHLADLYERTVQSVVFIRAVTAQGEGSGSGFVWDTDGHVVTNYHVVQDADLLTVKFFNGREYTADIVAWDLDADLAVIKLNDVEHELVPIAIGSSSDLRPGEMAIALGNPFGEEFTMTTGIVSAVSRTLRSGFSRYSIPAVVQTDAAINPGNSGGPLLDMNGAVIGVNTQIRSESRQSSGVGFAVPVDLVKRVIPSLIEDGHHEYSLMGITGDEVGIQLRSDAGLPGDVMGAYVVSVTQDGPADQAGIREDSGSRGLENWDGDVIVSIDSIRMTSMDDLIA